MYVLNVFANVAVETVELQIRQLNFSLYIIRLLYFVYLYISLMFGFILVFQNLDQNHNFICCSFFVEYKFFKRENSYMDWFTECEEQEFQLVKRHSVPHIIPLYRI